MITREMASSFMKSLKGTIYGDPNHPDSGIMSPEHIADLLGIAAEKVNEYLRVCAKYGITERQGGAWVV